MAQKWAQQFYKSSSWIKCRNSYIQERINVDGGLCEECHKKPGYIVHHKMILTQGNITDSDISLNHNNLKYVCKECHDQFDGHGLNKGERPLCLFDADGQPISLREIDSRDGYEVPP